MEYIQLVWRGGSGHSNVRRKSDFVKAKYVNRRVLKCESRTEVVRFFMDFFIRKKYSQTDIRAISHFLNRHGLTRSERHAIILNLGYHYKHPTETNFKINGYYEHKIVGE